MRDYKRFFRRLCLAMGIAVVSPVVLSCADPEPNTASGFVDVSTVDSQSAVGDATPPPQDSAAQPDTAMQPDTAGPGKDIVAIEDTGPSPVDVPVVEDAGPTRVDAGPLPPADVGPAPEDTVLVFDAGPPPEDAGPADAGPPDPPDAGNPCESGEPLETCYTADQLVQVIENPPFGGKPGQKPYDGPLPPAGCPDPDLVLDGCCNPAAGPGHLDGNTCCYQHCQGSCCGRPLVIDGAARTAELKPASRWSETSEPGWAALSGLSALDSAALAAAWRQDALDEHASVASFMRFGLELLHLGAPPELVASAARASADEVRHAQLTCRVASALDGREDGPGALACADVLPRSDWAEIAAACVFEGCVGETLAAAQLDRAARGTRDAAVADVVREIAEDEARHAELAWAFVAWSWRQDAAGVRHAIHHAFHAVADAPILGDAREEVLVGVSDSSRRLAGRLGAHEAVQTNRETLRNVIIPCAKALMTEVA